MNRRSFLGTVAAGLLAARLAAHGQHPTIPWGDQPVLYLDVDSATPEEAVVRGALPNEHSVTA